MTSNPWFDRQIGLALFRVVAAFLVLRNLISYLPYAEDFFGGNGLYPASRYTQALIHDHVMFLKYPFFLPAMSTIYLKAGIVLAVLLLLGVFGRLACLLLFFYLVNLQLRNPFIFDGSDNVIQVTLPFLAFSDAFRYRVRFFRFRINNKVISVVTEQIKKYALIGFLLQICFIYFFTAINKLHSDLWYNGTATYYALRTDRYMANSLNYFLTRNLYFVIVNTYLILLFELAFAFLIWFRKTKWVVIAFGTLFHIGIWIFMKIDVFPWIMIASYFVFVTDEEYAGFFAWCSKFYNRLLNTPPFKSLLSGRDNRKTKAGNKEKTVLSARGRESASPMGKHGTIR